MSIQQTTPGFRDTSKTPIHRLRQGRQLGKAAEKIAAREGFDHAFKAAFDLALHEDRFLQVSSVAASALGLYIEPVFGVIHGFMRGEGLAAGMLGIGLTPAFLRAVQCGRLGATQAVKENRDRINRAMEAFRDLDSPTT